MNLIKKFFYVCREWLADRKVETANETDEAELRDIDDSIKALKLRMKWDSQVIDRRNLLAGICLCEKNRKEVERRIRLRTLCRDIAREKAQKAMAAHN